MRPYYKDEIERLEHMAEEKQAKSLVVYHNAVDAAVYNLRKEMTEARRMLAKAEEMRAAQS